MRKVQPLDISHVILGSTSHLKLAAVMEAFKSAKLNVSVITKAVDSEVNPQPYGLEEIMAGAHNRAKKAVDPEYPEAAQLGMENGLVLSAPNPSVAFDLAVVALYLPDRDRWYYGLSPAIEIPMTVVTEAKSRGFESTTIGKVIAEKSNDRHIDPHAALTGGLLTRDHLLRIGIQIVLAQAMADN